MSERIVVNDVGPRDGLQNQAEIVASDAKVELVTRLADAGVRSSIVFLIGATFQVPFFLGIAALGGTALFALSMGMGVPLILFGVSAGKLVPRAGAWMDAVKAVFGVGLLALAIWMLERILPGGIILTYVATLDGTKIPEGFVRCEPIGHSVARGGANVRLQSSDLLRGQRPYTDDVRQHHVAVSEGQVLDPGKVERIVHRKVLADELLGRGDIFQNIGAAGFGKGAIEFLFDGVPNRTQCRDIAAQHAVHDQLRR